MDERSSLYERYADAVVDCNAKTVQECLDEIIKQFNALVSPHATNVSKE